MPQSIGRDYYITKRRVLLKQHDRMMVLGKDLIQARYGTALSETAVLDARKEFEALIPQIPYIGGKANPLTNILEQMTTLLALYRTLTQHDKPVEEIGALVEQMAQQWIEQYPRLMRRLIGHLYMSRLWRRRTQAKAERSQQREHPGDFVYEVAEGDGQNFAWGINYLECGVVKFFKQQHADDFTPYMCAIDYLMFPAMGVTLKRQGTIAQGCTHCDFHFH